MKRVLNLNDFSVKLITAAAFFAFGLPGIVVGIRLILRVFKVDWTPEWFLIWGPIAIGAILFVILAILIVVEQVQDHHIVKLYDQGRAMRIPAEDGLYECQFCGNRKVKSYETVCAVCGKELKKTQVP